MLATLFGTSEILAQTTTLTGKESIRQSSNTTAKSGSKTNYEDFSSLNSYLTSSRTNVCSPETSLLITEESTWGISRSTINESGVPSFCLSLYDEAPKEDDVFNTTLNPAADINFNNNSYTKAEILEKIQRTMSVIEHQDYAPSSNSSITSNFNKAIAVVVWHYTDNLNVNNYNYS